MSADNWRTCPRCIKTARAEKAAEKKRVADSYGKVEATKFVAMLAESENVIELQESMREDYDIGIDDEGNFEASYRAHCDDCGFEFKFNHKEKAKL